MLSQTTVKAKIIEARYAHFKSNSFASSIALVVLSSLANLSIANAIPNPMPWRTPTRTNGNHLAFFAFAAAVS